MTLLVNFPGRRAIANSKRFSGDTPTNKEGETEDTDGERETAREGGLIGRGGGEPGE